MNGQTHVWSANEVRYYCTGSISLCRYRNRFGTENVITVQGCFHYTEVTLMISRIQFSAILYLKTLNLIAHYNAFHPLTVE